MGNGIVKYLIESTLSVIYSTGESCILCSSSCGEESLICADCSKKINSLNKSFKIKREGMEFLCYSSCYYNGIVMELIKRLKYKCDFRCGEVLGKLLLDTINEAEISFDIISFVPLYRKSLRQRGFNQGRFLAKLVSDYTERPAAACLKKIKYSKDQIGLDDEGRWENLKGSFKAVNKKFFQGKKVLLIDDVLTTGSTAFWCSRELLSSGAEEVIILTAAKSRV